MQGLSLFTRFVLAALSLATFLVAAQFPLYTPGTDLEAVEYGVDYIIVEELVFKFGETHAKSGLVQKVVKPGKFNGTLVIEPEKYVDVDFYGIWPAMSASPWLPNGTAIEYTYTRATALFSVGEVNATRDVEWYVEHLQFSNVWAYRPAAIRYALSAAVKSDSRPVFDCLKYVKTQNNVRVYNVTCRGNTSIVYWVDVAYYLHHKDAYPIYGVGRLCVGIKWFRQSVWNFGARAYGHCWPWEKPPHNVTIAVVPVGNATRLDIYVDSVKLSFPPLHRQPAPGLLWRNGTFYFNTTEARLFTGPYALLFRTTATAEIGLNQVGRVLRPLGSVFLFIGNDTVMMPPRYVLKQSLLFSGKTQARVELTHDGGVSVLPGRTYSNSTVYVWPVVKAVLHGRAAELPYRALLNVSRLCGDAVISGQYQRVGGWIEVKGPVEIRCTYYPLSFLLPNGTVVEITASFNKTFTWMPPVVVYGNGTRLEADPVSVFVNGPRTVVVNYSRVYYLTRVVTPLGVSETWTLKGSAVEVPVIDLGNGTRLVARDAVAVTVDKPITLTPQYVKQYLVHLIAPVNSSMTWLDANSTLRVELADPWEPGNGTRFARLLVNGTAERTFTVKKPLTLVAEYAEVYYWVEINAPFNATRGWARNGVMFRFPETVELDNETRLVNPTVREVVVNKPLKLEVNYAKKQYYIKIEGVIRWEGWTDAGSSIKLNETVVNGVVYTPRETMTADAPGVHKPLFHAEYKTTVRDALGCPQSLSLCETLQRNRTS